MVDNLSVPLDPAQKPTNYEIVPNPTILKYKLNRAALLVYAAAYRIWIAKACPTISASFAIAVADSTACQLEIRLHPGIRFEWAWFSWASIDILSLALDRIRRCGTTCDLPYYDVYLKAGHGIPRVQYFQMRFIDQRPFVDADNMTLAGAEDVPDADVSASLGTFISWEGDKIDISDMTYLFFNLTVTQLFPHKATDALKDVYAVGHTVSTEPTADTHMRMKMTIRDLGPDRQPFKIGYLVSGLVQIYLQIQKGSHWQEFEAKMDFAGTVFAEVHAFKDQPQWVLGNNLVTE